MASSSVNAAENAHLLYELYISFAFYDIVRYHTAPILDNGWGYVGELNKFVPVSAARVRGISTTEQSISVMLTGAPGEHVQLSFVNTRINANAEPTTANTTNTKSNDSFNTGVGGAGYPLVTIECTFGEVGVLTVTPTGCSP
jgi:hypothetical protein